MTDKRISIPRRTFIRGMGASAGVAVAGCSKTDPPTYGNLLRMGDNLTYKTHRLLLPEHSLAREYDYSDISSVPAIGTTNPADSNQLLFNPEHGQAYEHLLAGAFADWRLTVEGNVAKPGTFTLADLKRMTSRTQITRHTCEEGWSAIAQWTGVPLRAVLEACGMQQDAKFVEFHSYDAIADSVDMIDALHPQTILAYGMNGRDLPTGHGAPLRLRVERQLGYKSVKFIRKIVVANDFGDLGKGGPIGGGWAWYVGM